MGKTIRAALLESHSIDYFDHVSKWLTGTAVDLINPWKGAENPQSLSKYDLLILGDVNCRFKSIEYINRVRDYYTQHPDISPYILVLTADGESLLEKEAETNPNIYHKKNFDIDKFKSHLHEVINSIQKNNAQETESQKLLYAMEKIGLDESLMRAILEGDLVGFDQSGKPMIEKMDGSSNTIISATSPYGIDRLLKNTGPGCELASLLWEDHVRSELSQIGHYFPVSDMKPVMLENGKALIAQADYSKSIARKEVGIDYWINFYAYIVAHAGHIKDAPSSKTTLWSSDRIIEHFSKEDESKLIDICDISGKIIEGDKAYLWDAKDGNHFMRWFSKDGKIYIGGIAADLERVVAGNPKDVLSFLFIKYKCYDKETISHYMDMFDNFLLKYSNGQMDLTSTSPQEMLDLTVQRASQEYAHKRNMLNHAELSSSVRRQVVGQMELYLEFLHHAGLKPKKLYVN